MGGRKGDLVQDGVVGTVGGDWDQLDSLAETDGEGHEGLEGKGGKEGRSVLFD